MAQYRDAQEQRLVRAADLRQRADGLRRQLATLAAGIDQEQARMRDVGRWLRMTPRRRAFWSGIALGLTAGLFAAARMLVCL
jgi:hypothetical protein